MMIHDDDSNSLKNYTIKIRFGHISNRLVNMNPSNDDKIQFRSLKLDTILRQQYFLEKLEGFSSCTSNCFACCSLSFSTQQEWMYYPKYCDIFWY